jgi:hypothetical protein
MIRKTFTLLTIMAAGLTAHAADEETFHKGPYSAAEQALVDRNLVMEMYQPTKPSGHMLGKMKITDTTKPGDNGHSDDVVIFNFAREDAEAAKDEGSSMATFNYTAALAEQFLFAEGWDRYHHDRFFTRAYIQEGMTAFAATAKELAGSKHSNQ